VDATSIIPSLTTVRSPYELLGRKVFDLMLAAINGKEVPKMIAIPSELVIRQSCGCDPGKKNKIIFEYSEIDGADPAAFISGHREEFIEKIRNLIAPLDVDAGNLGIDTLLDILQNEIIQGTEVETYFTVQRLVTSSLSNKMRVELWQDVISEIRHFISPLLKTRDQIERAENFFHKTRLVVSDIQTIQKKQNLLHSLKQSIQMGVVSETLINSIETKKLRNAIYQTFPLFNVRNFLFAELIETPEGTIHAKLIAMLKDGKGWNFDDEILFSPTGLYPEKVKDFDSRVLFLLPVVYEENYMGYVIYGKIKNIVPFYSTDTQRAGWDIFSEKINEPQSLSQSLYPSLTRDVAKSFYICRLIKMRKEAEESLKILTINLKFRNRELQDFAHIASHDLQEPLRKITFFSERLNKMISNKITQDEAAYLSRINHAVTRMNELIAGLLAYSRITIKQQPFTRVNLKIIIAEVLQDIEVRMSETKGRVEVDDLPFIKADPLQMRQLFQNLIGNALKYHRKDVPPVVTVTSEMDGTYCIILISDNGIGFDQKHAEKIFGIFQRFVRKNEYEGTGVGLAICKKIIEQHGGTISACGEPGKGSRFVIRMPVAD